MTYWTAFQIAIGANLAWNGLSVAMFKESVSDNPWTDYGISLVLFVLGTALCGYGIWIIGNALT